ncbi:MAG TPA: hypothetical protein VNM92_14010 [Thermoanaerobaculia bacterium]|nr:hypothetical protein [Thermoanaerobaculia bacterium]
MCAETDEEAEYLALPMDLVWVRLHRGEFAPIPTPEEALAYPCTDQDRAVIAARRALQVVGSPVTVRARLGALAEETGADEIMIATTTYAAHDRLRSYELVAEAFAPDSSRLLQRPPSTTIAAHS